MHPLLDAVYAVGYHTEVMAANSLRHHGRRSRFPSRYKANLLLVHSWPLPMQETGAEGNLLCAVEYCMVRRHDLQDPRGQGTLQRTHRMPSGSSLLARNFEAGQSIKLCQNRRNRGNGEEAGGRGTSALRAGRCSADRIGGLITYCAAICKGRSSCSAQRAGAAARDKAKRWLLGADTDKSIDMAAGRAGNK